MTGNPQHPGALGALTSDQVARLDAAAAECGVSTLQLMEIAGWQVARCAWQRLGRPVVAPNSRPMPCSRSEISAFSVGNGPSPTRVV